MSFYVLAATSWFTAFLLPMIPWPVVMRRMFAILLPLLHISVTVYFGTPWESWERLAAATLLLLYLLKASILLTQDLPLLLSGRVVFMTIWPGMNPRPFVQRKEPADDAGHGFVVGLLTFYLGVALLLALTFCAPQIPWSWQGWLGIAALLITIHFGYACVLHAFVQLAGWKAGPLFDAPLRSDSLQDFWTKRWNLAFVEMDRALFLKPLMRTLGAKGAVFGVFVISGLLHEAALSYPVQRGYGGPLSYFILQGLAFLVEHRWKWRSRIWIWAVILLPTPLLFHEAFREQCIIPLITWAHEQESRMTIEAVFDKLLWVMGGAHFCVLIASFQVPARLKWKEDLAKLTPFNRKLMWTYGVFIVFCILAFGVLTFALHHEFMIGSPAAIGISIFIASFWALRVIVDAVVFTHDDWPPGPYMKVGHALLTSLFVFLVLTYGGLAVWHLQ